jgi:hypothetical protein
MKKQRPILFKKKMVEKILCGQKTQTRRVIIPQPGIQFNSNMPCQIKWPKGQPGDWLWVRETIWQQGYWEKTGEKTKTGKEKELFRPVGQTCLYDPPTPELRPTDKYTLGFHHRPSIHMPKWASRIMLEILSIRCEMLRNISGSDIYAEGVDWDPLRRDGGPFIQFRHLWNSINGKKYSWETNPWVWVIAFKELYKGSK